MVHVVVILRIEVRSLVVPQVDVLLRLFLAVHALVLGVRHFVIISLQTSADFTQQVAVKLPQLVLAVHGVKIRTNDVVDRVSWLFLDKQVDGTEVVQSVI